MNFLDAKYNVVCNEHISEFDTSILIKLYQPIAGSSAIGLYLTLVDEYKFMKKYGVSFQLGRLIALTSGTEKQLDKNLKKLEALKLIKTSISRKTQNRKFQILTPLSPQDFLNNEWFNCALIKKLGEENYEAVKFTFIETSLHNDLDEFEEITSNFAEVFEEDISDDLKTAYTSVIISRKRKNLMDKFVDKKTLTSLLNKRNLQISLEDPQTISLIETALGAKTFTEIELVLIIEKSYNFATKVINENIFKSEIAKELAKPKVKLKTKLSKNELIKVEEFENFTFEEYYEQLLEEKPGPIMTQSLKEVKDQNKLTDGALNCLIDYSFYKNKGKIITNYLQKIADTLVENAIHSTEEIMLFLKEITNSKKPLIKEEKTNKDLFVSKYESIDLTTTTTLEELDNLEKLL
ncbi:DnaD domain protein [Mesoplasma photuris]|uniref:DnaD domain protein n=1 Tax=Mesoplasma photuris TaxID=217731 RepID=UPI0004E0F140|nr:DnaD domain protein [Mesoplasma photuris]